MRYAAIWTALFFGFSINPLADCQEKQSGTQYEVDASDYGFKISRPNTEWKFQRSALKPGTLLVKVSRARDAGKVETTVIANRRSKTSDTAIKQRDADFAKTKGKKDEYSNRGKKTFRVDRKQAPGFVIDWKVQGAVYRVQQCYVANQDFIYTIAIHSPVDQFEELADSLEKIRDSIRFVRASEQAKRSTKIRNLVARCGSEIDWAKTWDDASRKAKQENKSILVQLRSQPGFDIADGFTTIALMDQDIIELVNEYCVAFRYEKGMSAPIQSYDKYGVGPNSFGNTVLLVTPDGTVFGDTFTYEPHTFYDFLLTSLASRVSIAEPPKEIETPIQRANWFVRRGDFAAAARILESLKTIEAHRLRATLFRRQRRADSAIEELGIAHEKTDDAKLRTDLSIDKTIIGLTAGHETPKHSLERFQDLLTKFPKHSRAAELSYWIGVCQFATSNKKAAQQTWENLVDSFNENNRWTWRAAAALESISFRMDIPPEFSWPSENVIRAFRSVPFEKLKVAQIEKAEQDAIVYLIETQQNDGSWISPPDALKAKGYRTSPFTIAITSICARSLLKYRDDAKISDRVDRAFDFLVQSNRDAKKKPNKPFYMDYSPWADAYLLRFLAKYSEKNVVNDPEKREQLTALVSDAVKALASKQKPGGGWSYYVTHDLGQANQPSNQSISFMTAATIISLLETRDAGFDVPDRLIDIALDCLERMRNKNDTYTYFLWHEREDTGRLEGEEGAAGRGPLCALALSMAKRSESKETITCLDLFLKYRHLYSRERGKSLMHAAPGGQGSHYLMFDYAWAATAAASLPDDQKKLYRDQLLELILSSRSEQGSFLDNPINGWHYGTGLALEAMNLLR